MFRPFLSANGIPLKNMKEILLTRGFVAIVDESDYAWLNGFKWYAWVTKWGVYPRRNVRDGKGRQKGQLMHRLIMDVSDPQILVDHRNRNTLDCRRNNLRVCNDGESVRNRKMGLGKAGYKGVHFQRGRWRARVGLNGDRVHVGYFTTAIEAARAYDVEAKRLHGEFACLNFPDSA